MNKEQLILDISDNAGIAERSNDAVMKVIEILKTLPEEPEYHKMDDPPKKDKTVLGWSTVTDSWQRIRHYNVGDLWYYAQEPLPHYSTGLLHFSCWIEEPKHPEPPPEEWR